MSNMTIEEFEEKVILHIKLFVNHVNASDESGFSNNEDLWWEKFTDFSMELNKNE